MATRRRRRQAPRRARPASPRRAAPAVAATPVKPVAPKPMVGRALPVPNLIGLGPLTPFTLSARPAFNAALAGRAVSTLGFGGSFRGPALAIRRGEAVSLRLENATGAPLTWSVPTLPEAPTMTAPIGGTAQTRLQVDRPAALHLYRAAAVDPARLADPMNGMVGPLIIIDADAATLPLPSRWGVDDVPVLLDDATLDAFGQPVAGEGLGATLLANGMADAVLTVPKAFIRLRLFNVARARVFRLYFEDETPFHLIASDGGFLPAPISLDILRLAPGERAEVLVDCTQGFPARLMTTPDNREQRFTGALVDVEDQTQALSQVLGLDPQYPADGLQVLPVTLALPQVPAPGPNAPRRDLTFGHRAATSSTTAIDGASPQEPWTAKTGEVEVWRLDALHQAETIRVEGARIAVLSEADAPPQPWNQGVKDTIFVDRRMEIAIVFDRPTPPDRPHRVLRVAGRGIDDADVVGRVTVTA